VAQSGNGIDIAAVYQLLLEMSARMDGMSARLDSHDRKLDQLLDVGNEHGRTLANHTRQLDDLNAGVTELRSAVAGYHETVISHGIHYSELGERVSRVERHLKLEPSGG
jgi:hypothetical protein